MWVPKEVADWFKISKDSVDALREELAAVKAERDLLKSQLQATQINLDWIRVQVNTLQLERAVLMEKAYKIQVPVPEVRRAMPADFPMQHFSFEDVGDETAKQLGLPIYGDKN